MLKGIFQPHRRKKTLWSLAASLAILVLAITSAFFFKQYLDIKKSPEAAAQATSQRIIEKVGALYMLPGSETPTVAKVEDKSKLEGQPFFKAAENGDYLLVYKEEKMALLYREADNKLINVREVNTDSPNADEADVAGEQAPQKPAR